MVLLQVMIEIDENIEVRLQERLHKIWKAYGKAGSGVPGLNDFANHILSKYLNRKKLEDQEEINGGLGWTEFRRKHFNEIYKRDFGQCCYCRKNLSKKQATLDHILSPLRGGKNTLANICLACAWCNSDKSMLTDEEYFYKQLANAAKGIYPPK